MLDVSWNVQGMHSNLQLRQLAAQMARNIAQAHLSVVTKRAQADLLVAEAAELDASTAVLEAQLVEAWRRITELEKDTTNDDAA